MNADPQMIDAILSDLSARFHVPVPQWTDEDGVCGGAVACYDPDTQIIHFPITPTPGVVAHEFGHAIHDFYNIPAESRDYEVFARFIEKWYTRSQGLETFRCLNCVATNPEIPHYSNCFKCKLPYSESRGLFQAFGDVVIERPAVQVFSDGTVGVRGEIRNATINFVTGSILAQVKDETGVPILGPAGVIFTLVPSITQAFEFLVEAPKILPIYGNYTLELFVLDAQGAALGGVVAIDFTYSRGTGSSKAILGVLAAVGIGAAFFGGRRR